VIATAVVIRSAAEAMSSTFKAVPNCNAYASGVRCPRHGCRFNVIARTRCETARYGQANSNVEKLYILIRNNLSSCGSSRCTVIAVVRGLGLCVSVRVWPAYAGDVTVE
jgi:hypothetical protein